MSDLLRSDRPGSSPRPAALALADGTIYRGRAFGAVEVEVGEVCFNTSMTGYQEILTDPSYAAQIVVMTYPEMGNVGTNREDEEAGRPWLSGFVVRELAPVTSNWRAERPLGAYLEEHGVPGIVGIDTRAVVRRIREEGFQTGALSTDPDRQEADHLVGLARTSAPLEGRDLVAVVTCEEPYEWTDPTWTGVPGRLPPRPRPEPILSVVAYDYGIKRNILRLLVDHGFDVTVVPATTPAEEALERDPDAVFLSNGPGDPAAVAGVRPIVAELVRQRPLFGICLGHQILGLALGGETRKLKFGHHGGNQPGKDLVTGRVAICAENHGYSVDAESLRRCGEAVEITHVNLNDDTVEGLAHAELPVFSVQYHPEASPGPHDADYFFGRFREMVLRHRRGEAVTGLSIARGGGSGDRGEGNGGRGDGSGDRGGA